MNWCTAVFISIFSVSVTASDYKASPSSTEITMFLGNTLQSHTQLHLLLMGDIEKAEQQMISGLGLDILILANIVSGEIEVGPKNHQHAINRLVALAVFREVFKIEAWHNDAQISDILDSVKKQYPEQFDRYMCHDWLSSTWSREPDC